MSRTACIFLGVNEYKRWDKRPIIAIIWTKQLVVISIPIGRKLFCIHTWSVLELDLAQHGLSPDAQLDPQLHPVTVTIRLVGYVEASVAGHPVKDRIPNLVKKHSRYV